MMNREDNFFIINSIFPLFTVFLLFIYKHFAMLLHIKRKVNSVSNYTTLWKNVYFVAHNIKWEKTKNAMAISTTIV